MKDKHDNVTMEMFEQSSVLKPPFHYTGNKYKVIDQLFDGLPEQSCSRHIDLFGGSGVVACNLAQRGYVNVYYNELSTPVYQLFDHCVHMNFFPDLVARCDSQYDSSKEGYMKLRHNWNTMELSDPVRAAGLYNLISRSFSNGVRFNSKGEFNLPYGERNHCDIKRVQAVSGLPIATFNLSFDQWDFVENDWVYLDIPYRGTSSHYSEGWTLEDDERVLALLDHLDSIGAKFCYTNVLRNRRFHNELLDNWIGNRQYHVQRTGSDFRNTSFRKSSAPTIEIIIRNY